VFKIPLRSKAVSGLASEGLPPKWFTKNPDTLFEVDLAELIDGDRVGLVLFAGGAWPRMPLTVDYGALRFMVRDSEPNTLLSQGSDLGAGIDEGLRLLGTREEADQALVIISDGEDHEAGAIEAAKRAAAASCSLHTMDE
jgi:Ca-activated chloride channel family protein